MLYISNFVLELNNIIMKTRKTLLITSIIIMGSLWLFIALERGTYLLKGIDLFIFILIVLLGVVAFVRALKKDKEEQLGLATEDELSNLIKYKTGYYTYLYSMYMWLFIFIFKDKFPNTESIIGGGVLLSAIIYYITNYRIKQQLRK